MAKKFDLQKLLVPEFPITALVIDDFSLRIFGFNQTINQVAKIGQYKLPPGVIENGILKKPEEFQALIGALKQKIWAKDKHIWLILSLPSSNFYTNIFTLPDLTDEQFQDAVVFNTQMVAPLPLEETYFDWEDWGTVIDKNRDEKEIFIALGIKRQIKPYTDILQDYGFKVVAIEPWAISVSRFVYTFLEKEKPVLVIDLRVDGLEFIVTEQNKLIYFDYDSWQEIFGQNIPKTITLNHLQQHLMREIPLILNFYSLKRGHSLERFIVLSSDERMVNTLTFWLAKQYNLIALNFNLPQPLARTRRDWAGVIGAALRGLIPRREDSIVSLAPLGTEESYYQSLITRVVALWSNSVIVALSCLLVACILLNHLFFNNISAKYKELAAVSVDPSIKSQKEALQKEAEWFNVLVEYAKFTTQWKKDWKLVLDTIFQKARQETVNIKRIFVGSGTEELISNITIQAEASSREAMTNFKKSLDETQLFVSSKIPPETVLQSGNRINFSLMLTF